MRCLRVILLVAGAAWLAPGCRAHGSSFFATFSDVGNDVTPRFFHRASRLADGRVLVTGGNGLQIFPPSLVSLSAVSVFDPGAEVFTSTYVPPVGGPAVTPTLGVARSSHTQTTLADGRVLVTGGYTGASGTSPGTAIAGVELFDPATGVFGAGPAMSSPRAAHTATLLPDARVVVAGSATWEIFVPGNGGGADAWAGPFPLVHTRTAHAAVAVPGVPTATVVLIGGAGSGPATLERLDPASETATVLAPTLATGVDDLAAVRLDDGTVLIVGGQCLATGDTIGDTYVYDPGSGTLVARPAPPNVPAGIADHAFVALGRYAALFGGEAQSAGADTELDVAAVYDRAAGDWVWTATMLDPHDDFAAVVLEDESVLLVGGGVPFFGQEAPSSAAERFAACDLRPPDLDGDGNVGFADLDVLLAAWGPCPGLPGDCTVDLDGSGGVGFSDLNAVLGAWGACP